MLGNQERVFPIRISSFGLFLALVVLAGCGFSGGGTAGPDVTPPPALPLSLAGTYLGTNVDSTLGAGSVGVNIVQSGTSLSGTLGVMYATTDEVATLSGAISGTSATITATPSDAGFCPLVFSATLPASGQVTSWSGTYTGTNCTSGKFNLSLATSLPSVAGTYNNGIFVYGGMTGTIKGTITQTSGGVLSGSWSTTFTNAADDNSGIVAGMIVSSNAAVLYLVSSSAPLECPFAASAALGSTPITGSFSSIPGTCPVTQTGTFTLQ